MMVFGIVQRIFLAVRDAFSTRGGQILALLALGLGIEIGYITSKIL